jgi:uncharacterized protein (TIGR02145 family)
VKPDSVFYFKDTRDNKTYKAITFGNTTWMAEPLRYKTTDSYCYKGKNSCKTYGRMYGWADAMSSCPIGWSLPDTLEWEKLLNVFGGANTAGLGLAYYDSSAFQINYGFPPNIYGRFADEANEMHFWSSTSEGATASSDGPTAWHYFIVKDKLPFISRSFISKNYNLNCLCIKKENSDTSNAE